MVTASQWRKLALSMPEAEEKAHFGKPDFRVRNKIFCGMDAAGTQGYLKLAPEAQAMLLEARPEAFYPAAGAWGVKGWTHVVLAEAKLGELRTLIEDAWRAVAPKALLLELSGEARSRKRAAKTR
jgi:hypothetical protein